MRSSVLFGPVTMTLGDSRTNQQARAEIVNLGGQIRVLSIPELLVLKDDTIPKLEQADLVELDEGYHTPWLGLAPPRTVSSFYGDRAIQGSVPGCGRPGPARHVLVGRARPHLGG
jgi:hypothetical protein